MFCMLRRYRKLKEDSCFQRRKIEDDTLSAVILRQNYCNFSPSISFYLLLLSPFYNKASKACEVCIILIGLGSPTATNPYSP